MFGDHWAYGQSDGQTERATSGYEAPGWCSPALLSGSGRPAAAMMMCCQVEGCMADLSLEEKQYCQKKRICSYHMRADCIKRPGDDQSLWRFCFQCGKLELLDRFDGVKRSCRVRLERRKLPPRRSMTWTAGSSKSSSSTTCSQHQQMMLMQQQQEQQSAAMLAGGLPAAGAAAASSGALVLLQQQAVLIEQKHMQLQALRAAMAQDALGMQLPGLSPGSSGTTTPSVVTPSVFGPARVSFAGIDGMTASAQHSPSGSVGMSAGPQQQQQQQASSTAAAAAAAFADSCSWPFGGGGTAAAAATAAASAPVPQADAGSCELPMSSAVSDGAALHGMLEFDMLSDDDFVVDPLAADFVAVFPELVGQAQEEPLQHQHQQQETAQQHMQPQQHNAQLQHDAQLQQVQLQEAQLQHELSALLAADAASQGMTAAAMGMMPCVMHSTPAGFLPGGAAGSMAAAPGASIPKLDAHQLQIQHLMQSVQSLHESVRQLSLRVQSADTAAQLGF